MRSAGIGKQVIPLLRVRREPEENPRRFTAVAPRS